MKWLRSITGMAHAFEVYGATWGFHGTSACGRDVHYGRYPADVQERPKCKRCEVVAARADKERTER